MASVQAGHNAEDVVEIARYSARQPTDSFHLLSLAKMLLGALLQR